MNINDITSGPATSPADLIDLEELLQSPIRWAFRGQSQSYGTLVPTFPRIFGQKRSVDAAEIIERELIKTFRKHMPSFQGRLLICLLRNRLVRTTTLGA